MKISAAWFPWAGREERVEKRLELTNSCLSLEPPDVSHCCLTSSMLPRTLKWEKNRNERHLEEECAVARSVRPNSQDWDSQEKSTGEQLSTISTALLQTWMQIPQNGEKPHKFNQIYIKLITTIYWAATACQAQNPLRNILQTYIHFHSNFMARCIAEFRIFSASENRQ